MGEIQHAILRAHQHQTAQGQGRRGVIPLPWAAGIRKTPKRRWMPSFATQMQNYFPERGRVISRRGSTEYADTTDTGAVETLFNWVSGANNKLFAFTETTLYDVTDPAGVAPVTGVGSVTAGRWRAATMNGQGILVNGTDEPLRIDGTGAWVAHGFSAVGLGDNEPDPSDRVQEPPVLPRERTARTCGTATSTRSQGRCTGSTSGW